jgi:hypothetical protein
LVIESVVSRKCENAAMRTTFQPFRPELRQRGDIWRCGLMRETAGPSHLHIFTLARNVPFRSFSGRLSTQIDARLTSGQSNQIPKIILIQFWMKFNYFRHVWRF